MSDSQKAPFVQEGQENVPPLKCIQKIIFEEASFDVEEVPGRGLRASLKGTDLVFYIKGNSNTNTLDFSNEAGGTLAYNPATKSFQNQIGDKEGEVVICYNKERDSILLGNEELFEVSQFQNGLKERLMMDNFLARQEQIRAVIEAQFAHFPFVAHLAMDRNGTISHQKLRSLGIHVPDKHKW
jgi:hypothetical protein